MYVYEGPTPKFEMALFQLTFGNRVSFGLSEFIFHTRMACESCGSGHQARSEKAHARPVGS
jgi:hypothetical protein